MKRILIKILPLLILIIIPVSLVKAENLPKKLSGKILLQVESHGEAWYVNPTNLNRYYMADGNAAFDIMRNFGVGITNSNLTRFQNSKNLAKKQNGKIFLQVEDKGQAYYVNSDGTLYYLKDGSTAYNTMRNLGLGITNSNLDKIPTADITSGETTNSIENTTTIPNPTPVCNPNWQCNVWSSCTNSQQTRTCNDVNSCGSAVGKPNEIQSCNSMSGTPTCTLTATTNSNGSMTASWTSENTVSPAILYDNWRGIYEGGVIQWQTIDTFNGYSGSRTGLAPATDFKIVFSDGTTCQAHINIPSPTPGTLNVIKAPGSPLSTNIVAGSTDVVMSVFKFSATGDSFNLRKISLLNSNPLFDRDIATVYLYQGQSRIGTGSLSNGIVTFTNLDVPIAKDTSQNLIVKADFNTIAQGSVSGDLPQLDLYNSHSFDDGLFFYWGNITNGYTAGTANVQGNAMTIVSE